MIRGKPMYSLLFFACAIGALTAQTPAIPVAGTLIVAVPTRDGLMIAADRRTYDSARGDLDTTLKIRPIGPFTAITTTGNATWMDSSTLQVAYNAKDIAEAFFREHEPQGNLAQLWDPLARTLLRKFKEYLEDHPVRTSDLQNPLFQMEIFHYEPASKVTTIHNLRILYNAEPGQPQWDVQPLSANSGPIAFGNTLAYRELSNGNDARFDHWRHDAALRKLMGKPLPANRISKEDALRFCQQIIRASAQMLPLIDRSDDHVGATMDVALIAKTGLIWTYRDK